VGGEELQLSSSGRSEGKRDEWPDRRGLRKSEKRLAGGLEVLKFGPLMVWKGYFAEIMLVSAW